MRISSAVSIRVAHVPGLGGLNDSSSFEGARRRAAVKKFR